MNAVLAAGGAVLGLLPFVISPTRTFARGGAWRFAGAALVIVSVMLLFFDVRDMTGGVEDVSTADAGVTDADVSALAKLFGD
ncbi:MAG: hypothetical protein ABI697_09990 [Devosia sp.]